MLICVVCSGGWSSRDDSTDRYEEFAVRKLLNLNRLIPLLLPALSPGRSGRHRLEIHCRSVFSLERKSGARTVYVNNLDKIFLPPSGNETTRYFSNVAGYLIKQ